ncbi:hypothetical protein ACQJBY_033611 [Aegilops geniculata]
MVEWCGGLPQDLIVRLPAFCRYRLYVHSSLPLASQSCYSRWSSTYRIMRASTTWSVPRCQASLISSGGFLLPLRVEELPVARAPLWPLGVAAHRPARRLLQRPPSVRCNVGTAVGKKINSVQSRNCVAIPLILSSSTRLDLTLPLAYRMY